MTDRSQIEADIFALQDIVTGHDVAGAEAIGRAIAKLRSELSPAEGTVRVRIALRRGSTIVTNLYADVYRPDEDIRDSAVFAVVEADIPLPSVPTVRGRTEVG